MLWKAVLALGLVLSICAVTFPLDAEAQQVGRVYRIGVLSINGRRARQGSGSVPTSTS